MIMDDEGDEKKSLIQSTDKSIDYGNVIDVTSIGHEVPEKLPSHDNKRWRSIYVMYFTMFISSITFSIVITSVYPYLLAITSNRATTSFYGYVIAIYSLGQLLSSPVLGYWSDHSPAMLPILLTLTITIIFNILYSYAAAFPSDVGQYIVLVSRAMIGVGAGNAAVCRSYVSVATTQSERIGAFGIISAAQALGFIIGPVLGLAFVPLGSVGVSVDAIKFNFNMFTGPAYLSVVLAILNILLVVLFFREFRLIKRKTCSCRKVQKINIEESTRLVGSLSITNANINSTDTPSSRPRPFDKIASIICIAIFFAILFVFSVFETIIIPYSMDEFAWSKQQGQLYNNILFGVVSIISATVFISTRFIVRCVDERTALVCGMLLLSISVFILIPMGDDYPPVNMMLLSPGQSDVTHNGSSVIPLIDMTNTTSAGVGCRYPLISWCLDVPQLSLAQYILSVIVLTLGYPSSTVLCFTIFSKILGPHPQGVMMGLITAAGSFARTLGPLCVTTLYDETGPQITLAVVDGVVVIAVIVLVFAYYRLVPFGAKRGFSNKI